MRVFAGDAVGELMHVGLAEKNGTGAREPGGHVEVILSGYCKVSMTTAEGYRALLAIRGPGDLVGEYRGRVIDASQEAETSSASHSDPSYTLLFAIDDNLMIDAGVKGNSIRFMNHSCDPNCETTLEGDRVFVHALRHILAGEELTYDYNTEGDKVIPCRCRPGCNTKL